MSANSETFVDDKKTQKQLEDELGPGVEKPPVLPKVKPKLTKVNIDLGQALDVKDFIEQINELPDSDKATDSVDKYDDYERTARRMWIIKMAEKPYYEVEMRTLVSKESVGNYEIHIWKRDEQGKLVTEKKHYFFNGMTLQQKDIMFRLVAEREAKAYDLNRYMEKLRQLGKLKIEDGKIMEEQLQQLDKKEWAGLSDAYNKINQDYYIVKFKMIYGATNEEIDRIDFADIVRGCEVGDYIEGVKSPQLEES